MTLEITIVPTAAVILGFAILLWLVLRITNGEP